jgi:hypothetical protein
MLGRAVMAAGGYVAAHHLANRLSLLPADIALVGVRHPRQPIAARGDHSVDGGVVWTPPNRLAAILILHRQIEIVLVEPEQSRRALPSSTNPQIERPAAAQSRRAMHMIFHG